MSSSSIYKPTWLYIKRHKITGLLYFGKTIGDVLKYNGSGKYWKRHIKKYGIDFVETIWCELFFTESELKEFSTLFSEHFEIVKSGKWANLIPESGIDGAPPGIIFSEQHRENIKKSKTGVPNKKISQHRSGGAWYKTIDNKTQIYLKNNELVPDGYVKGRIIDTSGENNSMFGVKRTEEWKQEHSEFMKKQPKGEHHPCYGKPRDEETKRKISEKKKGVKRKPFSEETKAKMRKQKTPEHVAKIKAAKLAKKMALSQN